MSSIRLTPDPALPLPDTLFAPLAAAVERAGALRVPPVRGVAAPVVVRWLYRRWLDVTGVFRPLVHVDGPIDADALPEVYAAATGGWLYRTHAGPLEAPPAPGILPLPRLVTDADAPPLVVAPSQASRWNALDEMHHTATDPALDRVRRSLYSHARTGAAILLHGPAGAGRRSLVRLAWTRLGGDAPLVDATVTLPTPDAWAWFPDPASLDEDQRQHLRRRLTLETPPTRGAAAASSPPRPPHPAFTRILGDSPALSRLLHDAARVARSPASVLVLGEPGAGKELLARALHDASGRKGIFEAVDLSSIPRDLVESELFGHVRGAFTGATGDRAGAFRRAEGGTLFLDELGNLDPTIQVKLLRVLQERVVRPVGSERTLPVDVRVVAATNADLDTMVGRGQFRLDLLHRLNAITLRIPPLRERPEDILLLAARFLAEARNEPTGVEGGAPFTPEAADLLLSWPWPGNVRELWGVMMRAGAFSAPGELLTAAHLEPITRCTERGPTFVVAATATVDEPLAVKLAVPDLGERGLESLRHAVLTFAAGRLVRLDAMDVLTRGPLHGGLPALRADLDALLAAGPGPIDRDAILRALPHLLPEAGQDIHVEMAAGGPDSGLERRYSESALIIGRARSLDDLGGDDRRGAARLAAVRSLGGTDLAFLAFPSEGGVSRAQVLIRRNGGLEVHLLPDAAAPTWIHRRDGSRERLALGRPASLGDAGAVEIQLDREGTRRLCLGLYLGAAARARGRVLPPRETAIVRVDTVRSPDLEPVDIGRGSRVWALDAAERALLNAIVLAYREGDFSAHLREGLLARRGDPAHVRLASYLLRTRPTQYCARVYDSDANVALREELAAALETLTDVDRWLAALPAQMSAVIGPAVQARSARTMR